MMVIHRVQLKYRLEREISNCYATGAIEVQARERYIFDGHATGAIKLQARGKEISDGHATGAI